MIVDYWRMDLVCHDRRDTGLRVWILRVWERVESFCGEFPTMRIWLGLPVLQGELNEVSVYTVAFT